MSQPESCGPLLLAIDEVAATGPPGKRSVTFKPCQRPKRCSKLRLILSEESDELRLMQVSIEGGTATIEMTPSGLQQLREAVVDWRDGADDFGLCLPRKRNKRRGLGSKDLASLELWFWGPYYGGP